MTNPDGIIRARITEKLRARRLPFGLPPAPTGTLQGRETIRIGAGLGRPCSGCDEPITADRVVLAQEYEYQHGLAVRFHDECWKIWDEERRRTGFEPRC